MIFIMLSKWGAIFFSNIAHVEGIDDHAPSHLPHVRSDTAQYFQKHTVALEHAYLQKSWDLGSLLIPGLFFRVATGYFERAYGGIAVESLYFPTNSCFAVGFEQSTLWKRCYSGIGFTTHICYCYEGQNICEHFVGNQCFINLHYMLKPWNIDCKVSFGQFLAKDQGGRLEVSRTFPSGLRVGMWYTQTSGHGKYVDVVFSWPLDLFWRKSSRIQAECKISTSLHNAGSKASTGKSLYKTISSERLSCEKW